MVSIKSQEASILSQLRENGYKITPQRRAVIRVMVSSSNSFTPELLLAKTRELFPSLGRVTVYRTLDILDRLGLLCHVHPDTTHPGYALGRLDHHHHIVCSKCGRVSDFSNCGLAKVMEQLSQKTGFKIKGHILEIYGLCPKCQEAKSEK